MPIPGPDSRIIKMRRPISHRQPTNEEKIMMRELTLEEAKPIWDRLVPEKIVWTDDWDIRVALCREYNYKPRILYDGKNFFPLQSDPEVGYYEILGGDTVERNYLTFDPEFKRHG